MPCLLPPQLTQARAPTSDHWIPSAAAATVATELSGSKSPPFYFL